ncbi:MAG TPA: cellulose biosynthesis protein BcsP [Paraburkholderia sp.]|nr:cellulose biosynthesis protein BcsP [Paraburkholderia sp.]
MTLSRDIETLFDHFGGNAQDYQEIGRENEARTARTRWPLLVTLDLSQPSIPVVAQRHSGGSASASGGAAGSDPSSETATPIPRGKVPLLSRPHRRDIPAVEDVKLPPAIPAGDLRFSSEPESVAAADVAAGVATNVSPVAAPQPAPAAPAVPAVERKLAPAATHDDASSATAPAVAPPEAQQPRSFGPAARPDVPRTPTFARAAAPVTRNAPAPTARAEAPSILGKLFNAPAAAAPQPPASSAAPAALPALFERLRNPAPPARPGVGAGAPAAGRDTPQPASNAWLVRGPRRS